MKGLSGYLPVPIATVPFDTITCQIVESNEIKLEKTG